MFAAKLGNMVWHYWRMFTRPASSVVGDEARQQATMLAALSLVLFLASLVNGVSWNMTSLRFAAAPLLTVLTIGGLLLVYILSRTAYYRIGALFLVTLLLTLLTVFVYISIEYSNALVQTFYFLVVIIFLASLLLPMRILLLLTGLGLVFAGTTFFIPGVAIGQAYSLLLFTAVMSFLLLIATNIRNNYLVRLHASEEQFRYLFQHSPDTIYVYNLLNQEIEYINREQFLGYSREELLQPDALLNHTYPADLAAVTQFWQDCTQQTTQETKAIDYRIRHKNGEWEWVHNRLTPFSFTPEGAPEQLLVALTLVTERKQAEDLLQSVAAAAPNAMVVTNTTGQILYANPQVTQVFGYQPDELIHQNIILFIPERIRPAHAALFERYFQNPAPRPMGHGRFLTGRKRDGEEFPLEIALSPIHTPTGLLVLISMTDVTEQQRVELKIRQQTEYLRILLEQTPIGIVTINKEGAITDANVRSLEILSLENPAWSEGYNVFTTPDFVDTGVVPMLQQVLETGQPDEKEIWYTPHDGKERYLMLRAVPHFDGGGEQIGLILLAEDLTQRVQAEEGMRRMQKMESLGVLAGGIAHDFNNLLVAMLGQTSLALAKSRGESLARPHIEKAVSAAERAAQLTQQLLAYSGRGQFQIVSLNLNDLIEENLHLLAATIPKHIALRTRLAPSLPYIEADLAQMQQVVMNLIINAAEAIGEQTGAITIITDVQYLNTNDHKYWHYTLTPLLTGSYVTLEMHDNGCGISSEAIGKIFDPFFTTKPTGHGLGLAAVVGIVKGHKGGLTVYSELNRGTTFKLLFPTQEDLPALMTIEETGLGEALQGLVLVIDDEWAVRDAVTDILGLEGVEVIAAADGESGLALYQSRQQEIGLVLLDLSMPGWSGERTLRELRHLDPEVRIILSSGYNEIEATQQFTGKALTGFLQKPYSTEQLLNAVKQHLSSPVRSFD